MSEAHNTPSVSRTKRSPNNDPTHSPAEAPTPRLSPPHGRLLPVAAGFTLLATGGILMGDPRIRSAVRAVVDDPKVHDAARSAAITFCSALRESWRQNSGPDALAHVLMR